MEEEFTIEDSQAKCQDCKFYIMIDSGYGYCRRFPPKWKYTFTPWRRKREITYQVVEWCRKVCGEFAT